MNCLWPILDATLLSKWFWKSKKQWYMEISVINAQLVEIISDKSKYSRIFQRKVNSSLWIFRPKRKTCSLDVFGEKTDHAYPSCTHFRISFALNRTAAAAGTKKLKSKSFHQYSWNSEVGFQLGSAWLVDPKRRTVGQSNQECKGTSESNLWVMYKSLI